MANYYKTDVSFKVTDRRADAVIAERDRVLPYYVDELIHERQLYAYNQAANKWWNKLLISVLGVEDYSEIEWMTYEFNHNLGRVYKVKLRPEETKPIVKILPEFAKDPFIQSSIKAVLQNEKLIQALQEEEEQESLQELKQELVKPVETTKSRRLPKPYPIKKVLA